MVMLLLLFFMLKVVSAAVCQCILPIFVIITLEMMMEKIDWMHKNTSGMPLPTNQQPFSYRMIFIIQIITA